MVWLLLNEKPITLFSSQLHYFLLLSIALVQQTTSMCGYSSSQAIKFFGLYTPSQILIAAKIYLVVLQMGLMNVLPLETTHLYRRINLKAFYVCRGDMTKLKCF